MHTHEMIKRADKKKCKIYHFSTRNKEQLEYESIDGVTYIRHGNALTVILAAMRYYWKNRDNIDYVIDQCNTHRFFTSLWVESEKRIFYIHQLTKEIWDYNAKFPLSKIGKVLEESFLKLNRFDPVITVSKTTRSELVERGYDIDKIKIIYNGVSFRPWERGQWLKKDVSPTFIYVGRYSPYKGIDLAVRAFIDIKKQYPDAKLWILGKKDPAYVDKKIMPLCVENNLSWKDGADDTNIGDIISWGYVSEEKKLRLLSRSWALLFPSIREGWGIPITEAGCVGTPSIVFDSPGICEAIDYGKAGYLCTKNTKEGLVMQMRRVITDKETYDDKCECAYQYSSQFQWDKAGAEFEQFIAELRSIAGRKDGKK